MDSKKIAVLLKAVDEGSFIRAGEALDYSQSAITQMMNSLEQELGFKLLLRTNRGVSLTAEGQKLAPLFRELLNINERISQECALVAKAERGTVRIGALTSMTIQWLPGIIYRFQKQHPQIEIELQENGSVEEIEKWLTDGRIDIGFVSLEENCPFDYIELAQDPLCAVLPIDHALKDAEAVPMELFSREPFIMYRFTSSYEASIHHILDQHKIKPQVSFFTNFDQTIVSLVRNHLGVSIMPGLVLKGLSAGVLVKPLDPPAFRRLGIIARSMGELAPAARAFVRDSQRELTQGQPDASR